MVDLSQLVQGIMIVETAKLSELLLYEVAQDLVAPYPNIHQRFLKTVGKTVAL